MDKILIAEQYAVRKKIKVLRTFIIAFILIVIMSTVSMFSDNKLELLLYVAASIMAVVCVLLTTGRCVPKSVDALVNKSKVFKDLAASGCLREFISTIETEIAAPSTVHFSCDIYRLTLYVTPTWLIFISANGSIIRHKADVSKIYKSFAPSRSRDVLVFEFADGTEFRNMCDFTCDDILSLLQSRTSLNVANDTDQD
ncbi:MAG: hypothetical protein LBC41_00410 [Clostridiales bacterium]|jgi:hypothetical protein|nr:hypothetical protein [Clostridiales bacterium]